MPAPFVPSRPVHIVGVGSCLGAPIFGPAAGPRALVEAVRKREGVRLPRQQGHAIADRPDQHGRVFETREVDVLGEVLCELLHGNVIPTPEGHPVELHPQAGARKPCEQQLIVPQLLRDPHGQGVLPGELERLPLHRRLRRLLHRHQQPLVGLGDAGIDQVDGDALDRQHAAPAGLPQAQHQCGPVLCQQRLQPNLRLAERRG